MIQTQSLSARIATLERTAAALSDFRQDRDATAARLAELQAAVEEGLAARILQSRLNWSSGRVTRVMDRLVHSGHVGSHGDRYRAIPPEYQAESGAM